MEYKTIKSQNYFQRSCAEFFPPVIVVSLLALISNKVIDLSFTQYLIIGFSIIWGIITHIRVKNSINRIEIKDGNILIEGTEINKRWCETEKIENTSVRIKSQGFGRGNVEYYLKIILPEITYTINKRKEWNYYDLIEIYNHISYNKYHNEDKDLLDKMKLKSKGFSSYEIAFGKKKNK